MVIFFPPQLIYPGSTAKSQSKNIKFPTEWHVTQTANHWSNEDTMLEYIDKIIVPYVESKRKELNLPDNYPALALFDHFSGQITSKIFSKLDSNNISYVLIPATFTDRLQPMDLSVNKSAKNLLRNCFQSWYAAKIESQMKDGAVTPRPVDMRISVVKPVHAQWLIQLYDHMKSQPQIIINGFRAAGILDKIK